MLTLASVAKPKEVTKWPEFPVMDRQRIRVTITEATDRENRGSMGAHYVREAARWAGFNVEYEEIESRGLADVELVSVHHCMDWPRLARLPRTSPIRLAGGHPTTNNIRPGVRFADAWCVGEGETWIAHALRRLNNGGGIGSLRELPGTVIGTGDRILPPANTEASVPRHPPYLNRDIEGHSRVWYLELSRGCPFACDYCELGWAWKYRTQNTTWLLEQIDGIDRRTSSRVSLFAPDEASHPGYGEILQRIHDRKLITSFGSMRLEQVMRRDLPFRPNMLIRIAVDGLTEDTRNRVHRRQTNQSIYDYFRYMTDRGHTSFKVFTIFGYPWESLTDFDEWQWLWSRILSIPRRVNAHVRVKFTPLIPQPSTPLGDCDPIYDEAMAQRIRSWFHTVRMPTRRPGWFVVSDGVMSRATHARQVRLTRGDEDAVWREMTVG